MMEAFVALVALIVVEVALVVYFIWSSEARLWLIKQVVPKGYTMPRHKPTVKDTKPVERLHDATEFEERGEA